MMTCPLCHGLALSDDCPECDGDGAVPAGGA